MRCYEDHAVDLVEAIIGPAITKRPWIYSLACFQEAMAFNYRGFPLPRFVRRKIAEDMFLRDNFKALIFWSEAGRSTLTNYGGVTNQEIHRKSFVVYPAIMEVPESRFSSQKSPFQILFSGDFFRKGGVHVVDAFESLQSDFPDAVLRLCCDEDIDFRVGDSEIRSKYLAKIYANSRIVMGRVSRKEMLEQVLPQTDIYVLPTYDEAFGFAILEAMAYGIPVIATDVFAIPEIIDCPSLGVLISTSDLDLQSLCKGYVVRNIPVDFRELLTSRVATELYQLASDNNRRAAIGMAAKEHVREKFSFRRRNAQMSNIYEMATA